MNNQHCSWDDHENIGILMTLLECHLLTEPDSCLSKLFHKYFLSFLARVDGKLRPKLVRASSLRLLDQNLLFVDVGEKDISSTSENCPENRNFFLTWCFRLGFAHIAIITQVNTHNRLCSCYKPAIG